eukprot:5037920-Amphidinium_carterae.1
MSKLELLKNGTQRGSEAEVKTSFEVVCSDIIVMEGYSCRGGTCYTSCEALGSFCERHKVQHLTRVVTGLGSSPDDGKLGLSIQATRSSPDYAEFLLILYYRITFALSRMQV